MGRSATQESAHAFLERLQLEAKFLSYDQIDSISNALAKATAVLHQARNDRSPLFKLPIEILHKILEFVPDPCTRRWKRYHPFWRNSLTDSSMLIPVTHACHRLREVALAHPHLWTTLRASFKELDYARQMATWSQHIPLNIVGSDVGVLSELPPNTHFRSIHLYDIGRGPMDLRALAEQFSSPSLSSFSLLCNENYDWNAKEGAQPLPLAHTPNLRHLVLDVAHALPDSGFPKLTHLALRVLSLSTPELHARFTGFIRECPQLESVALSDFSLKFAVEDISGSNVPAPIPLQHLRHVTFIEFSPDALRHYLALLQPCVRGSSVQILGYHARDRSLPRHFLLPTDAGSVGVNPQECRAQAKVCIGLHSTGVGDDSVSLATVFAHTTRRIASWEPQLRVNGIPALQWPSVVFADDATSPWTVDEVWLYGANSLASPWERPPLPLFSRVRAVVLAVEGGVCHDSPPSLCPLPFVHGTEPGEPVSITNLRLVRGFKEHDGFRESAAPDGADGRSCRGETSRDHLPLSRLIRDFKSGGYEYLKHFVLQVTPHIDVDERELDVLRSLRNLETFKFERIAAFPDMPGHWDPAYSGGQRYPGALW